MRILFIVMLLTVTGCSHLEHNQMIRESNNGRLEAYGKALAMQTTEGGRMALTITYALGVGQQDYVRPETFLTYATGLMPYANLFMNMWYLGNGQGDNSPTYHVEGANNSMYVTNESKSRNTAIDDSYNTHHEDSYNTLDNSPTGSNTVDWSQSNPVTYP